MATGGLYGQSSAGIISPQSGSESSGLYGNNTVFGGTYFEWFIFQVAELAPATPTGGSWSFTTNTGTPPTGWVGSPPVNPTNTVWVSVGLVNSKSNAAITWSTPGKFSFASGLPILSGASAPLPTDGQTDQLYIQTGTTPETIWFKQAGTWTRLTGSTLYVDLVNDQTIAGTKTFSNQIQGSVSGTSANVTGIVDITHGGTGSTSASAARTALGAAALGANSDITSLSGLTTPLSITQGGTGANTAAGARTNLGLGTIATQNANSVAITGGLISNTTLSAAIVDNAGPYIDFANGSAVTLAAGRLWYNGTTGSWNAGMGGGNITQQIGEELFVYGKASAAITDSPLQIIYQTGTVGASGVVTFAPTVSGITNGDMIIGVATEPIANNGFGRINSWGIVHGVTTNGTAYGEVWNDNDTIWYNPVTGNPTNVKPVAPNIKVSIGTIIKAGSGGSGTFSVEIAHGSVLGGTDSNVQLTSPSGGQMLSYDQTAGYWKNINLSSGTGINVTPATNGAITVANTGVTSVTGTSPVVSSGGATPAISMAAANTTTNGYLTSADWNTFNGKQPAGTYVNSVSGTTGRITSTGGVTPTIDLASGIATPGTTGSSTLIPVVTVDTYGRVTTITTAANPQGTVTSVGGTGTVNGLTLTGTVTSTGNLTLGGTLSGVANSALTNSSITFGSTTQALGSTVSALNGVSVGQTTTAAGSFTTLTASSDPTFTSTGAVQLPSGTTAQQPTGVAGKLRFNTTTAQFEGYNGTTWASVGGAAISNDTSTATNVYPLFASATSGTALTVYTSNAKYLYKPSTGELSVSAPVASNGLFVNADSVNANYTVATGTNAFSIGPITVATGITVTVASGQRWVVI